MSGYLVRSTKVCPTEMCHRPIPQSQAYCDAHSGKPARKGVTMTVDSNGNYTYKR